MSARAWPLALAAVLLLELLAGALRHESDARLAAAAREGDVRQRAVALYRLSSRDDGSAATAELRDAARKDDPRLAVLVAGVLDTGPGAKLRRRALVANAPDPQTGRWLELMLERSRSLAEYRQLLSGSVRPR